jgi:DNA polymerase sigma
MKVLAVVLKALLQQAGLNERVAGGLGSYTLLNLIMAHLMCQARPSSILHAYMLYSESA